MDIILNKKLKILHQVIYEDDDYDHGHLIIMFIEGDEVVEVVATKYINNQNFCDVFRTYKFYGFNSN